MGVMFGSGDCKAQRNFSDNAKLTCHEELRLTASICGELFVEALDRLRLHAPNWQQWGTATYCTRRRAQSLAGETAH